MEDNHKAANIVTTNKQTNESGAFYLKTRAVLITVITPCPEFADGRRLPPDTLPETQLQEIRVQMFGTAPPCFAFLFLFYIL
jgi:hypothetical protein